MKITVVQGAFLPVPPLLGGAVEKMWHVLTREFARRGHEVIHVSRCFKGLKERETSEDMLQVRVPGFDTPESLWKLKLLDLIYSRNCARVLTNADIIVTNTFWLPMFPSVHRKGAVYVDVQRMPRGQMRFYHRAARLRANSRAVARAIREESPALSNRVAMIPNLLPFPSISRQAMQANAERPRVLLFVGRVHPEKGIHLLIEAYTRIDSMVKREWKLHIVGPWTIEEGGGGAAYLERLKSASKDLPITFFGSVHDPDALSQHYHAAPVFVYPSLAAKGESFGLAPLEAMAHGAVPVVSKLECFQDFITHEENGVVFDQTGPDAAANLALALTQLMASREYCSRLSEKAWEVNVTHAPEKIAGLFLQDFERVIEEGAGTHLSH
jgi:glycosyltransferase involved in cell wall biosynthesis